jgi:alpha-tubulin suppressor-like RCC1 family protein
VNVSLGFKVKSVSTGGYHTCAILDDDNLKCWGKNTNGQLGYGHTTTLTSPAATVVNVGSGRTVKSVSVGLYHTCAILYDNTLKCWGYNYYGQLGYGNTDPLCAPFVAQVDVGFNRTVKSVSAGFTHTCAILDDNTLRCWGDNSNGQLGYGSTGFGNQLTYPSATLVIVGLGRIVTSVATGRDHTCAILDDRTLKCWGARYYGQLGYGSGNTDTLYAPSTIVDVGMLHSKE